MSALPAEQTAPAHAPLTAFVRCVEPTAGRHAARLLAQSGFAVSIGPAPPAASPGALVVVCGAADGAEGVREIRTLAEANPGATILVVMPDDASNTLLRRALAAGAAGLVFDADVDRALVVTAHAIAAGQLAVPEVLGRQIAPHPLSHREKQILGLVVHGLTNREIGQRLYLAESTVKSHLSSAFRKIDVRSRSEAVARIQDPDGGLGAAVLAALDGGAASLGVSQVALGAGR